MLSGFSVPPVARLHTRSHYAYGGSAGEEIAQLQGAGTPGETVSLSFALEADRGAADVVVEATRLDGRSASIPQDAVDVHVVHVWDQAGVGVYRGPRMPVPELLLKDDRVSLGGGYRRRCASRFHLHRRRVRYAPPRARLDGPVRTDLRGGAPKQLWLTVRIPPGLAPGTYHGKVDVTQAGGDAAQLTVELEVLPLTLAEPEQDLMLWYLGTLDCRRHQHYVAPALFEAQLRDIHAAGFRSLSLFETDSSTLQQAVDVARAVGFESVVLAGRDPGCWERVDFGGLEPVVYASDELDAHGDARIADHAARVRAARVQGMRSMSSLLHDVTAKRFLPDGDIGPAPEAVSLYLPNNLRHFAFHAASERPRDEDVRYYWQTHMEKPNVHRLLAGIYLWKSGARGISPYCYQHLPVAPFSPFDDFDEWEPRFHVGAERRPFKDHMTTYPARDGAIPTVQWRGLGEGLTDLRYLETLDRTLRAADRAGDRAVHGLAAAIRERVASTLARFSLSEVEVLSETETEPYPGLRPEAFRDARMQIARDAVELQRTLAGAAAARS